jgi:uncharacterized protein
MIIDLKAIPREGSKEFEFSLNKDWWQSGAKNDQVLGINSPLKVRINIYRAGGKYVLEGSLDGSLKVMCDRCLEPYHRDLKTEFRLFLAPPPSDKDKAEIELLEEDMEVGFINDEEIDLGDLIKEQLFLSLPIKSLCTTECLGLCSICGSNLNDGDCGCEKENLHPGLSKLKNIKFEGE